MSDDFEMSPMEIALRDLAIKRHDAHGQRYGDQPYEVHLAAVRRVLLDFGYSGNLVIAAWGHDLIEDTDTAPHEIEAIAGPAVVALVWAVTGVGKNRRERWASVVPKIRATPFAVLLKLADRIANVEASTDAPDKLRMYQREQPRFEADLAGLGDARMWERLRAGLDPDGSRSGHDAAKISSDTR